MSDDVPQDPPVARYRYTLVIRGNTLDEIEHELTAESRGGFLLDSDYLTRDEFKTFGGVTTATLEHLNPEMTPDRYAEELHAWCLARKAARAESRAALDDNGGSE